MSWISGPRECQVSDCVNYRMSKRAFTSVERDVIGDCVEDTDFWVEVWEILLWVTGVVAVCCENSV